MKRYKVLDFSDSTGQGWTLTDSEYENYETNSLVEAIEFCKENSYYGYVLDFVDMKIIKVDR